VHRNINNIHRLVALTVAAGLAAGAMIMPAAASAKSYKVRLVNKSTSGTSPKLVGTVKGKPLGKCKYRGTLTIPDTTQVWRCKRGKIYVSTHGTSGTSNDARATWKVTKGTGRYKGIRGRGKVKGKLSTSTFIYTGTLKF
jgi:hypothetical protein